MQELSPTCTIKNVIRNKPVSAITIFLPTAEVKKKDHFIFVEEEVEKINIKIGRDEYTCKKNNYDFY